MKQNSSRISVSLVLLWQLVGMHGFLVDPSRTPRPTCRTPCRASTPKKEATTNEDNTYYYSPNVPLSKDHATSEGTSSASSDPSSTTNEYSFFDEAIIYVRAGSGGQGSNTYKRINGQQGPPDGGNGGNGGNVILMVDPALNTLAGLTTAWRPNSYGGSGAAATASTRRKSFRAEHGADGGYSNRDGRTGKDVVIRIPPGTVVEEQVGGDDDDEKELWSPVGSLAAEDDPLIVATGGEGGEGTGVQRQRGVRRPRLPAKGGERKVLKLTLKIVADVALVGVPNAGKRWKEKSLLGMMTMILLCQID